MSMMKKMSLVALAVCAVSTAAHAEVKSWGTATASVKVNAMQEWGIAKVRDGNLYLDKDNDVVGLGPNKIQVEFKVVNNSATASKYYIAGAGASYSDKPEIFVVKDDDATMKYRVMPAGFKWDSTAKKYLSPAELGAGESRNFTFSRYADNSVVAPGNYTVSVELFVPTV